LIYNPHPAANTFQTDFGPDPADLYDAVSHQFTQRKVRGNVPHKLAPETAAVIVVAPARGSLAHGAKCTFIDGVLVDYGEGSP
jgi:hypothetical protein